jgi:hypothetical protein
MELKRKSKNIIKEGTLFMLSPVVTDIFPEVEQTPPAKEVKEIFKKFNINPITAISSSSLTKMSPRKDRKLLRPLLSPKDNEIKKDHLQINVIGDKKKMNVSAFTQLRML